MIAGGHGECPDAVRVDAVVVGDQCPQPSRHSCLSTAMLTSTLAITRRSGFMRHGQSDATHRLVTEA
jgi:hypothetical protein